MWTIERFGMVAATVAGNTHRKRRGCCRDLPGMLSCNARQSFILHHDCDFFALCDVQRQPFAPGFTAVVLVEPCFHLRFKRQRIGYQLCLSVTNLFLHDLTRCYVFILASPYIFSFALCRACQLFNNRVRFRKRVFLPLIEIKKWATRPGLRAPGYLYP